MATSRGFQVNVLPQSPQVDPRLFSTSGQFLGGLNAGLGTVGALGNIYEEAQMRAPRRRLAEIQVEQGENALEMAPYDRAMRFAQIDNAIQEAAVPRIVPGDMVIEDTTEFFPAALDEEGNRTGEGEEVLGDLVAVRTEELIGPGGTRSQRQVRNTVKTAEQRAAERSAAAANLEATRALANQRNAGPRSPEYIQNVERYREALANGDTDLAALYEARIKKQTASQAIIPDGVTFQREVERMAAQAGVTLDRAQELSQTPEGMAALAALRVANQAASRSAFGTPQPTAEQRALITAPPPLVPATSAAPAAVAPIVARPQSKAEYDALPSGSFYIASDGTTRRKK